MTKMKAAVLYGREDLRIEDVRVPSLHAGDLLVRVRSALTCGTDVKVFRRGYHEKMIVPPSLFGHEMAGDVVAAGRGVTRFAVGDRVVAANSAPCGGCFFCLRGNDNLCEDLLFNNGAYAEYIRIPSRIVERNTYKIPARATYQDAALCEPLACVLRGLDETGLRAGDNLAVMGLGPIGLMFVRLAKVYGARVLAIGRRQVQLENARRMGASELILNPGNGKDLAGKVRDLTDGYGADVVIEAVGTPDAWETAVGLLRRGGTVNFFGGCPSGSAIALDTSLMHYSELTCTASFHHTPAHIRKALEMVGRGEVAAREFVNHEEPLEKLPEVMQHLMSHNGHMKTAIIP